MGNQVQNAVVGTTSSDSYSDPTSGTDYYEGGSLSTDGTTGYESSWTVDFDKWHQYYNDVAIFAEIIDTLALYAVGKGFKADESNTEKIKNIKGIGKDDFNTIIENLLRTCLMCGDSHAENIRDKAQRMTNLKPLNPSSIKLITNASGIIQRYEQKNVKDAFEPKRIFHLMWNRLADEIHGKPYAERVEPIIKQIKQIMEDLGLRFHRIVKPLRLFEADTNDETQLAATEVKLQAGYKNCEIIVIPKGTLEEKDAAAIPNAQDAIDYLNLLIRELIISCGVPEVVLGWSVGTTDASAKVVYLGFQQRIEKIQRFLEAQIKLQLGIELNFEFPASLEPVTNAAGDIPTQMPQNNTPASDISKSKKLNTINPKK